MIWQYTAVIERIHNFSKQIDDYLGLYFFITRINDYKLNYYFNSKNQNNNVTVILTFKRFTNLNVLKILLH